MFIWVSKKDYDKMVTRLDRCERFITDAEEGHRRRSTMRDTMFVKVIPTICTVALVYVGFATVFHWS